MESQLTIHNRRLEAEVLARQGLRLPPITLKCLRTAGIYCQPSVSIEHQHLAKKYVLRGVESGGAVAEIGAYASYVDEQGNALPWLQRVDSIGVNGVHAIVVAPVLIRLQMLRIERTYDLLITRHQLARVGRWPEATSGKLGPLLWPQGRPGDGAVGERCCVPRHRLSGFLHTGGGMCGVAKRLPRCCPPNHVCRVLRRLPSLSFARTQANCP